MSSSAVDGPSRMQEIMFFFRAGKMLLEGTRVVPDTRKGLVRIGRCEEGLIHFQWLDRSQNIVEDEPRADGDLHICNTVNSCINRPLDIGGEDEEASVPLHMSEMSEETAEDDLSSRAGNLVDQNMASELAGEVTSSAGPVQLADLQRILRSIQPAEAVEDLDGGLGLGDIFRPDLLYPLIDTLPLEQRLASYLPEGTWTPEGIMELFQTAPCRQQMDTFTHVLRTGEIDLSQFGIDPSKYKFTVLSFLEALDDMVAETLESGEANVKQDENKDPKSQRCSGSDPMDES